MRKRWAGRSALNSIITFSFPEEGISGEEWSKEAVEADVCVKCEMKAYAFVYLFYLCAHTFGEINT